MISETNACICGIICSIQDVGCMSEGSDFQAYCFLAYSIHPILLTTACNQVVWVCINKYYVYIYYIVHPIYGKYLSPRKCKILYRNVNFIHSQHVPICVILCMHMHFVLDYKYTIPDRPTVIDSLKSLYKHTSIFSRWSNLQTLNTNSCTHKSEIIWVFLIRGDHSMVHGSQVFTNRMIVCHPHSDFSKIHFNKPKTKTFSRFGMRSYVAFEPRSLGNLPRDLPPALHQESQNISRLWGKGHDYINMVQRSVMLHINIQTIKCRSSSHHIIISYQLIHVGVKRSCGMAPIDWKNTYYLSSHIAEASAWSTGKLDASGDVSSEEKMMVENAWMTGGWNWIQFQLASIATCFLFKIWYNHIQSIVGMTFANHGNLLV